MRFFHSGSVPIAFIDIPPASGAGDPVLLIHGFASNHMVNWVNTLWTKTLHAAGYRVIAFDNRGHGQSGKLYQPDDYNPQFMADDARLLLDHLGIERADVMGYSMGARIAAHLAFLYPERVRSALFGGLGINLVRGEGLPQNLKDAMEAPSLADLTDPMQIMFRRFAESNGSDLKALAACIIGSRLNLTKEEVRAIAVPVLIAVGTDDPIAGSPHELAMLMSHAKAFDIIGRDHNLAVGDRTHKQAALAFLNERP
jgi:pimeloyl-ACP methyl ester carboxylesterase